MPVYDLGYQTWKGTRSGAMRRWMTIPRFAFMEFASNRVFLALFIIGWLPVLVGLGHIYLLSNLGLLEFFDSNALLPPIEADFLRWSIVRHIPVSFLLTLLIGSTLICRDMNHHAMVLFFSKPIRRWEYFAGKFSVPFSVAMLMIWLPMFLLFVIQVLAGPDSETWRAEFWSTYLPALLDATLFSIVIAVTLSLIVMSASSLSRNGVYAVMIFVGFSIGSMMLAGTMNGIMGDSRWLVLSPWIVITQIGLGIFDVEVRRELSDRLAWSGLLTVWAGCLILLKVRLGRAGRYSR